MELLARIPKDRIAVLIGKGGRTRKMLEKSSGASLEIDSATGDVSAIWNQEELDPIVKMKMPDVIRAIGRGLAPNRAVKLLDDDVFLRMYDIREWVGRQPNQTRRMRSRLIGRNGRIRSLIEEMSRTEMAIYGSTVLVIGDEDGLALATPAIENILNGAEHGTVLHGLEQDRKRMRIQSRSLDYTILVIPHQKTSMHWFPAWLMPAVEKNVDSSQHKSIPMMKKRLLRC